MKRSELITIYRKSSPRTGRKYDSKLIEKRQLKAYLKRGYFKEIPIEPQPHEFDTDTVEEIKSKPTPPSELTEDQKEDIRIAEGTQREIAEKFNVSTFTVSRLKNGKIK